MGEGGLGLGAAGTLGASHGKELLAPSFPGGNGSNELVGLSQGPELGIPDIQQCKSHKSRKSPTEFYLAYKNYSEFEFNIFLMNFKSGPYLFMVGGYFFN